MRNLICIIFLYSGLLCKAQQQELFENDWYLTNITVDGIDYPTPPYDVHSMPPHNETSIEYFTEFSGTSLFLTQGCNAMDINIEDLDDSSFTALSIGSTLIECMYPLYEAHDGRYFNFFGGGLDENFPLDGFQYEILNNSDDSKVLVITNPSGDKAHYNNSQLSTSEILDQSNFQIAFQNDELIVQSSKSVAKSVSVYDLMGKLVLKSKIENNRISTSKLPKGIYIVKIADEKGNVFSKKVRK